MNKYLLHGVALASVMTLAPLWAGAQTVLSLEECRELALANNKQSKIAQEKVNAAEYEKKAAASNYLPKVSVTGAYLRNSENIALVSADQASAISGIGTTVSGGVANFVNGLMQDPTFMTLLASDQSLQYIMGVIGKTDLETPLNAIGQSIASEFTLDIQNIYVGMLSIEEPLYAGGKVRAYNKVTAYAKELAETQMQGENQKVAVQADQAYWQIVSIAGKLRLAEKYAEVLRKIDSDVEKMKEQGVATISDQLAVHVELNQAEMSLIKAQNGLALAKMLLCQLCGLDLHSDIVLQDEQNENLMVTAEPIQYTEQEIEENRTELKSLKLALQMYSQKSNIVRADFLPAVALMGSYNLSNPSFKNGYENEFGGFWTAGLVAKVPLFHFGEGVNKVRKAKSDELIAQYQFEEAKEKISLQITQYQQRIIEADARLAMAQELMKNADENCRVAMIGFKEGVVESSTVLKAETAKMQAKSEEIDAKIDRIMADVYLRQAIGRY